MTATTSEPVTIPGRIRRPATQLVADLANVAGDAEAVLDAFDRLILTVEPTDRLAVTVAALTITFSECITEPTDDHNNPVPVDWMGATSQGEHE